MKTFLVILLCAAVVVAVLVFYFKKIKMQKVFALEAQKLSDEELEEAIRSLWASMGARVSLTLSYKFETFKKEAERRELVLIKLL